MILEVDTELFKLGNISINQLVFLALTMNGNQNKNQDVHEIVSRIDENEIQELIDDDLIVKTEDSNGTYYELSSTTKKFLEPEKSWFDTFYENYPIYVNRPDGTKGFLRTNVNKCRKEYNRIVGKSKAMHEYILDLLKWDIDRKMTTGKLGYMKTMWKWITNREWEILADEREFEKQQKVEDPYGSKLL
jgi:hypothetical protein